MFIFEIAVVTRVFFPYIIIFNILAIIASAIQIEPISKNLFSKFGYLKKFKKIIIHGPNTVLICSLVILLFLSSIEATRNENALNKIRTLEIRTEIIIPTEDRIMGDSKFLSGVRNFVFLFSDDGISCKLVSDHPILSVQIATNTRKIYITHRPSRLEEIYGKQIETLDKVNKVKFNFNKLIELDGFDIKNIHATSTIKFSFFINGILASIYNENSELKEIEKGKIFWRDISRLFYDIGRRYDYMQKTQILN